MSICNSLCELVTDCFKQSAMYVYDIKVVKDTVIGLLVMYDNYYNQEEPETDEEELDLDDLLAGLENDDDLLACLKED